MSELVCLMKSYSRLKFVNFRGNKIKKAGIQLCLDLLDDNQGIMGMDLSENPGFSKHVSKELMERFLRNKQLFGRQFARHSTFQKL